MIKFSDEKDIDGMRKVKVSMFGRVVEELYDSNSDFSKKFCHDAIVRRFDYDLSKYMNLPFSNRQEVSGWLRI